MIRLRLDFPVLDPPECLRVAVQWLMFRTASRALKPSPSDARGQKKVFPCSRSKAAAFEAAIAWCFSKDREQVLLHFSPALKPAVSAVGESGCG